MEIGRHPSGAPFVKLHGKGQTLAATRGIIEVQVSLTHTATHAAASALALSIS
jgi:phosphopantetheinyl transferase (holo-ACP synthase)